MAGEKTPDELLEFLEETRKRAERAEALFQNIFGNSHSVMLIIDPEKGDILDANVAACAFYGYEKGEILSMKITDINTLSSERVLAEMQKAKAEERRHFDFQHRLSSGEVRDVEVYTGPIVLNGRKVLFSIIHDVSERKKIAAALQDSEKLLADVFDSIRDGISILDKDLTILRVNGKMNGWYARSLPLEGKKCYAGYHHREAPCESCPSLRSMMTGQTEVEIMPGVAGSQVEWMEIYSYPIRDKDSGAITGVVEFVKDISKRRRAEAELMESEEKYRLLVENATEAIFIAQDGFLKFPNPKTMEIIGRPGEDISNIPFPEFIHPDDRAMVVDMHRRRLAGDPTLPQSYSFRVVSKDGTEHTVELNAVRISWEGRVATLNFIRDITDQKRLETSFYQAQKLEAVGTLAGGIAHDFNNLLMGIQGRASLIIAELDPAAPAYEHVKGIEEYVKSATDLTKQLLGFARGGKYEVLPTDMNELVDQSVQMFSRTRKDIRVQKKFEDRLWTVEVDRRQMEQVMLNLFVNAWQAMPGGGELYLQTENVAVEEDYLKVYSVKAGRYAKISVTDTGVGMDEITRARVFEPFFTTKEMGRGTGLGLASAYGIIKNHNGFINVYSEKGKGTTFTIYLPASDKKVSKKGAGSKEVITGTGTILLVDDEQIILEVGKPMIERIGYRVFTAKSGQEAIDLFRKEKGSIDLVILDMIMPDVSGGDVFDRLKEIDPEVKVLLSSGYSLNGKADRIIKRGCLGFLQKPFSLDQLSDKIQKVLNP